LSSLALDLGVKALAYAAAGIPEYWVLNLPGRLLHVHRSPRPQGYAEVTAHGPSRVSTAGAVRLEVDVAAVLPGRPSS